MGRNANAGCCSGAERPSVAALKSKATHTSVGLSCEAATSPLGARRSMNTKREVCVQGSYLTPGPQKKTEIREQDGV